MVSKFGSRFNDGGESYFKSLPLTVDGLKGWSSGSATTCTLIGGQTLGLQL